MIIKAFRTNQPAILLVLPLIAGLFWMSFYFQSPSNEASVDYPHFIEFRLPKISILIEMGLVFLLIWWQSLVFNTLINTYEVFVKDSYLPALIYCLTAVIVTQPQLNDHFLYANLFMLYGIKTLLNVYRRHDCRNEAFQIGLLFGIAVLLAFPLLPMVMIVVLVFNLLKSFYWRESLLIILAAVLPTAFYYLYHFLLFNTIYIPGADFSHFSFSLFKAENWTYLDYAYLLFEAFCVISFLVLVSNQSGLVLRIRKLRQALIVLLIFMLLIHIALVGFFPSESNSLLLIPAAFLTSFLLSHTRLPTLADAYFYCILGLVILHRLIS